MTRSLSSGDGSIDGNGDFVRRGLGNLRRCDFQHAVGNLGATLSSATAVVKAYRL